MKKIKYFILTIITLVLITINTNVSAASIGLKVNKSSVYVGDSFTVTISGIYGRVNISGNSNISISQSGSQFVDGSLTISGSAKSSGTGTVTVVPVDVVTTGEDPQEVTTSVSRSITINEEPVQTTPTPTPVPTSAPTSTPTPTKAATPTSTNNNKPTNTNKKQEEKKEEKKEEDDFYISTLKLIGIKEDDTKIEIQLSPEFKNDVYEYTATIQSDIVKIQIEKDAGKYNNSVIIDGLEDIKEGENIITLKLLAEDHKALTYTIKLNKNPIEDEGKNQEEIQQENIEPVDNTLNNVPMINMPVWLFLLIQAIIVALEIITIVVFTKVKPKKNIN